VVVYIVNTSVLIQPGPILDVICGGIRDEKHRSRGTYEIYTQVRSAWSRIGQSQRLETGEVDIT
jgi:hypothetical protein